MSSQQATLDGFGTETPNNPDSAPAPDSSPKRRQTSTVDGIPNFNRESGRERTELGAGLEELCQQARDAPDPQLKRGRHRRADAFDGGRF